LCHHADVGSILGQQLSIDAQAGRISTELDDHRIGTHLRRMEQPGNKRQLAQHHGGPSQEANIFYTIYMVSIAPLHTDFSVVASARRAMKDRQRIMEQRSDHLPDQTG